MTGLVSQCRSQADLSVMSNRGTHRVPSGGVAARRTRNTRGFPDREAPVSPLRRGVTRGASRDSKEFESWASGLAVMVEPASVWAGLRVGRIRCKTASVGGVTRRMDATRLSLRFGHRRQIRALSGSAWVEGYLVRGAATENGLFR